MLSFRFLAVIGALIAVVIFAQIRLQIFYGPWMSWLMYNWWGLDYPKSQKQIIDPSAMAPEGWPIIYKAIESGDQQWVDKLIANGADINKTDGFGGSTPALWACMGHRFEICYHLLEMGANPDVHDDSGITIAQIVSNPRLPLVEYRMKIIDLLKSHNIEMPGPTPAELREKDAAAKAGKTAK